MRYLINLLSNNFTQYLPFFQSLVVSVVVVVVVVVVFGGLLVKEGFSEMSKKVFRVSLEYNLDNFYYMRPRKFQHSKGPGSLLHT